MMAKIFAVILGLTPGRYVSGIGFSFGLLFATAALSQSSPGLSYGQVLTAGQLNSFFASKQDVLTFQPLNRAGGTMSGKLQTAPSTINGSGFSILPGIAPSGASNGDLWLTSSGLFVQLNGQPAQLLSSVNLGTLAAQNANNVAITGGTINGTTIGGTTPAPGAFTALTLGTPLALSQGGCGATSAYGCLTNLGLTGGTTGQVLTSNGTGTAPTFQPVSPGTGAVRYDTTQGLTLAQQLQGRQNLGTRGSGILTKSAAYTVATTDAGKLIAASGTFALTLPSAASAGNGFAIEVANTGTGKITLTPNGSDTISGLATLVVNRRESGVLVSDGTNWQVIGFSPVIIAETLTATSFTRQWSTGRIEQGGTSIVTTNSGGQATVSYPLTFPTASVKPVITNGDSTVGTNTGAFTVASDSLSGFVLNAANNVSVTLRVNWRADGY